MRHLPLWAKITIAVASILAFILLIIVIVLCCQKCKKKEDDPKQQQQQQQQQLQQMGNNQNMQNSADNLTMMVPMTTTQQPVSRNGDYMGPVAQQGQTYRMPQQESMADELEPPPLPRVLPPQTRSNWMTTTPSSYSYTHSPTPSTNTTTTSVNRNDPGGLVASASGTPTPRLQNAPPYGRAQPNSYQPPPSHDSYPIQRDDSFVRATRQAATRYLPAAHSPSSTPSVSRHAPPNQTSYGGVDV